MNDNLNEYVNEIHDLSGEDHELYLEVALGLVKHLRRLGGRNVKRNHQMVNVLNMIYCHRMLLRKTA